MTKAETIKNHYISEFINSGMSQQEAEETYLIVNKYIDEENGKCEVSQNSLSLNLNNIEYFETVDKWRPISLRGIETNNSWIRIESEKDLPKEYDYFHLKLQSGDEIIAYNSMHRRLFVDCDDEIEYRFITHYAPIEKKSPPLH